MGSYLDDLLSEQAPSPKKQSSSYLDELLDENIKTGTVKKQYPTSSLFTDQGEQTDPASMLTHFKAGFVDDIKAKIDIYSTARGIPKDRYGVHKGEIVYLGDDKKIYRETPDTWWQEIKRFAADTGAHAPSIALSIIMGVLGGPGGAAIGAAGGEGYRKTIGAVMGEDQDAVENIKDMAVEGALATAGDLAGRGVHRGINYIGAKRGGKIAAAAGRTRYDIDPKEVKRLEKLAEQFGIDLYSPQTTGSKRLIDKFNLLGDLESSADIIQAARESQVGQINKSAYKFLDDISKAKPGLKTAEELVDSADNVIKKAKTVRSNKVKPLYTEAYKVRGVDTFETILALDDIIARQPKGTPARISANKIKQQLTRTAKMPNGKVLKIPEDRVEIIDKIKKGINAKWKSDPKNAPAADMQNELNGVLDKMLKSTEKVAPVYKAARDKFAELTPAIDKLKNSKIGELTKLKTDKSVIKAMDTIFSPGKSSPELVAFARNEIVKENPKAWDAGLRAYLQKIFEGPKESATGALLNKGGHFYKNVWGDMSQREILRSGMSELQFENLENLMTVLKRAGAILQKESATATRQEMLEEIGGTWGRRITMAITRPLYTGKRLVGDRYLEATLRQNSKDLAEAMVSEKAAAQLKTMKRLPPGSEKLLPALGNFIAQTYNEDDEIKVKKNE